MKTPFIIALVSVSIPILVLALTMPQTTASAGLPSYSQDDPCVECGTIPPEPPHETAEPEPTDDWVDIATHIMPSDTPTATATATATRTPWWLGLTPTPITLPAGTQHLWLPALAR